MNTSLIIIYLGGVRVSNAQYAQHGFTITQLVRQQKSSNDESDNDSGFFNLVVNGGGFITLQFIRQPYGRVLKSFYVPCNRIINIGSIFLDTKNGTNDPE
jgi:hypothetical protein